MIEVKILNRVTGEVRYEKGEAGESIKVSIDEMIVDYWPIGILNEGDPIEYVERRKK